jgi:hypothetical protein
MNGKCDQADSDELAKLKELTKNPILDKPSSVMKLVVV